MGVTDITGARARSPIGKARRSLGILLTLSLVVVACGDDDSEGGEATGGETAEGGAASEELREVRHRLNWVPSGLQAPLYYGVEQGIFEEEGFDLDILPGKGTVLAIEDLSAGNVDFAHASTGSIVLAIGQGRDVVDIGTMYGRNSWGFFFSEDSDIQDVEDLKGKTMLQTPGATESNLLEPALRQAGMSSSDVTLVNVEAAAKLTSYASGNGDTMVTTIPYGMPIVDSKRPSRTIAWSDIGFQVPDYSFMMSRSKLDDDPEFVRSYLRALYRSMAAAKENPEEAIDALVAAAPEVDREAALNELVGTDQYDGYLDHICSDAMEGMPVGRHAEEDWEAALRILSDAGLEGELEFERFATNQFFDEGEPISSETC